MEITKRRVALGIFFLAYFAIIFVGLLGIIYVALHFISKFW